MIVIPKAGKGAVVCDPCSASVDLFPDWAYMVSQDVEVERSGGAYTTYPANIIGVEGNRAFEGISACVSVHRRGEDIIVNNVRPVVRV